MAGFFGTLGELAYDLVTHDKTKAGVDSAKANFLGLDGTSNDLKIGLLGLVGVLAAVGTAAYMMASKAASYANQLEDMARMTGLNVTALQEWRYIVGQTGGEFEGFTMAVTKLTRELYKIKPGSDLDIAFRTLGVNARDAQGSLRGMDSILPEIIVKLSSIEDPVKRNSLAFQIFGREYSGVARILELSGGDIDKLRKKYQELGIAIDPKAVEAAAKFKKTQELLGQVIDKNTNTIATSFTPSLADMGENLNALTPVVNAIGKTMEYVFTVGSIRRAVGVMKDDIPDATATAVNAFDDVETATKELDDANKDLQDSYKELWDLMKEMEGIPKEERDLKLEQKEATLEQADAADTYSAAIRKRTHLEDIGLKGTKKWTDAVDAENRAEIAYERATNRQLDVAEELGKLPGKAFQLGGEIGAARREVKGTGEKIAELKGGTQITIQGNVNLAPGDTVQDWVNRETTTQAGVNLLQ